MTSLDPRQITLIRLRLAILALFLLVPLVVAEVAEDKFSTGIIAGPGLLLLLLVILFAPRRRYRAWGYRMGEDELAVRRGMLFRTETVVPFGRVQHIDVAQGPIERALGLATLILNTAGTRAAAVKLPGLDHTAAEQMRGHIRAMIRQDLI